MKPEDIANLISENIEYNNGLVFGEAQEPAIMPLWRKLRDKIKAAERRYKRKTGKPQILVVQGSDRNKNTCPGEDPKSIRLCNHAIGILEQNGCNTKLLDLSEMTVDKNKLIYPCKACYSTSPALCAAWCTCYPSGEHSPDWMHDEIYELLTESHGLFIITPVYWYSVPSVLKLMMDRMVCLDGANPDPTTTMTDDKKSVKDVEKAKNLERGPAEGGKSIWDYKSGKLMAGRIYSVFVHGDAEGADLVYASLTKTLEWYGYLGTDSTSTYIGHYEPYSDSHEHLDDNEKVWDTVGFQAKELAQAVKTAKKKGMPKPEFPDNELMK